MEAQPILMITFLRSRRWNEWRLATPDNCFKTYAPTQRE